MSVHVKKHIFHPLFTNLTFCGLSKGIATTNPDQATCKSCIKFHTLHSASFEKE